MLYISLPKVSLLWDLWEVLLGRMVPRLKRVMQGTYRLSTKYTFNVHFIRSFLPPWVNVYYFFHTLSIFIYFGFIKIASIGFHSLKIHDMDSSNRLQYLSCKLQATISADAHKLQIAKVSGWIQLFRASSSMILLASQFF